MTFRGQNAIPERAVPTPDGAVWWLFDDGTDYGLIRWDGSATLIPVAGVDRAILPRPDSSVWVYDVPGARWVQATAAGVVSYNPCPGLPVAPLNFTAAAWNEDWSVVLGQDANGDVWQVGPTGAAGRWRVGRIGWSA